MKPSSWIVSFVVLFYSGPVFPGAMQGEDKPKEIVHETLGFYFYAQARFEHRHYDRKNPFLLDHSEIDLYLRRLRLGVTGIAYSSKIQYGLSISADAWKASDPFYSGDTAPVAGLGSAYIRYSLSESSLIKFEKGKMPHSKIYKLGSSRQPLQERPYYISLYRDFFKEYSPTFIGFDYTGKEGVSRLQLAAGKSWGPGDYMDADQNLEVISSMPQISGRYEISRPHSADKGYCKEIADIEPASLGVFGSFIDEIQYHDNGFVSSQSRESFGFDISGCTRGISIIAEAHRSRMSDDSAPVNNREAEGHHIQIGKYFMSNDFDLIARHENLNHDIRKSGAKIKVYSVGANKYYNGQKAKLSISYEILHLGDAPPVAWEESRHNVRTLRVTFQLIQ